MPAGRCFAVFARVFNHGESIMGLLTPPNKPDPTRAHFYPDAMSDMWEKLTPQLLYQGFMDAMPKGVVYHPFAPPPPLPPGYGAPSSAPTPSAPPLNMDDAQIRLGPAAMASQFEPGTPTGLSQNPATGFRWLPPNAARSIFR